MKNMKKITEKFEEIKQSFTEEELEELAGLLAIVVNTKKPETENWKRLKLIITGAI